ncbi:MAG: hypothetical protein WBQ17_04145 [Rhizomicrobium sp.]
MKIPVGRTLEAAFTFGLKSFLSVLGTVWLPILVTIVLIGGAVTLSVMSLHGRVFGPDPTALLHLLVHMSGALALAWIVFMIMGAMIQVGLLRKALGLHPGPVFVYFSLGTDVRRMLGAMLLLSVIYVGVGIGFAAAEVAIFAVAHSLSWGPGGYWIAGIACVVLACAYIYIVIRISYFLPAVVVAENRIGIGRAWALGGGNFWRIVAVVLVIVLAVNIAASMLSSVFAPPFLSTFGPRPDPAEFFHRYLQYMASAGPMLGIVYLLQTVLLYGLFAGAAASAYRAVTSPSEGLKPA